MRRSDIISLPIELDEIAPGGRIGLIALATDFTSEQELRRMLPEAVEIFTNRVMNANPLTLENLREMTTDISRAAAGIVPGARLDVMIYGCTSGTVANGAAAIEQRVQQSRPGVPVTNPVSAALAAFEQLQVKRLSILTPYIEEVNVEMAAYFESHGLEVINICGLGFESDIDIAGIPAAALKQAVLEVCDDQAEALFISCTALRTASVIEDIEQSLKRPVITSNQALVWHSLRLIDYPEMPSGLGRLFLNG